jgi:hypothetical protein
MREVGLDDRRDGVNKPGPGRRSRRPWSSRGNTVAIGEPADEEATIGLFLQSGVGVGIDQRMVAGDEHPPQVGGPVTQLVGESGVADRGGAQGGVPGGDTLLGEGGLAHAVHAQPPARR